jgi:hypothetical protein
MTAINYSEQRNELVRVYRCLKVSQSKLSTRLKMVDSSCGCLGTDFFSKSVLVRSEAGRAGRGSQEARGRGGQPHDTVGPRRAPRTSALLRGQLEPDRSRRGGEGEPTGRESSAPPPTCTRDPEPVRREHVEEKGTTPPCSEPEEEGEPVHPGSPSLQ